MPLGTKLWATVAVLLLPIVGLGIFYVRSLNSTLWFTAAEQDGYRIHAAAELMTRSVARHAELEATTLGQAGAGAALEPLAVDADRALTALEQADAQYGNPQTHPQVADVRRQWAALKSAGRGEVAASLAAHDAVLDALGILDGQIGSDWNLTLDPELTAYNLIDVTLTKLPDARRFLSEARARSAMLYVNGEYQPAEGAQVTSLLALINDRLGGAGDELKTAAGGARDRPLVLHQLGNADKNWSAAVATWTAALSRELATGHPRPETIRGLIETSAGLSGVLNSTQDAVLAAAGTALELRHDSQARSAWFALLGSLVAFAAGATLMLLLSRRIARDIKDLLHISERITDGHFDNVVPDAGADELGRLFAGIAAMQRKLKAQIDQERAQFIENGRIRSALDNVSGAVMVADADHQIIYTNRAVEHLLRAAEGDIRRELPHFSAAAVRGANLDVFHRNPQHRRRMLDDLTGPHTAQLKVGGRVFKLTANPVTSQEGERIGAVMEWVDRTTEATLENEVQDMLTAVLGGELSRRIELRGKSGFFEVLGQGMNRMADNLAEIVSKVKLSAGEVHRAAQEISRGNTDLSQRTEQQSSSLGQTASSMERMTATVKQNADNALQASQLVGAAREQAQSGGAVVSQAVRAMTDINESSKKIASIIGVIDEIAFQTNILALNAAVEAARAGEQGRGFAVVASEVRSLASRSAAAAREIKELIKDSVAKVEGGSVLVTQSGETLQQIVVAVKQVTEVVADIAAASRAQSAGIEEVNVAITQMDEMTQQNAALVEQATAASQSMADQAGELADMLAMYRIDATPEGTASGRVHPKRLAAAG